MVMQLKSNPRWGFPHTMQQHPPPPALLCFLWGVRRPPRTQTLGRVGSRGRIYIFPTALCLKTRFMRLKLSGMTPVRISSADIHRLRTLDRRQINIENRKGESNVVVTSAGTYQFGCMGQATMTGSRHSHHLFTIPLYVRIATSRYQSSIFNHHRPQQVNPSHYNR
jgi:hypothetical protein